MAEPTDLVRELLDYDEAGHVLNVSRSTVQRLIKAGELGAVKIGARTFVPRTEIDGFIARKITRTEQA